MFYDLFLENKCRGIPDVPENEMFPSSKFPLENMDKPLLKLDEILLTGRIQHARQNEPEELKYIPSVTKILKETMSVENKLRLQIWEEKMIRHMGRDAFDEMQKFILLLSSYFSLSSEPKFLRLIFIFNGC